MERAAASRDISVEKCRSRCALWLMAGALACAVIAPDVACAKDPDYCPVPRVLLQMTGPVDFNRLAVYVGNNPIYGAAGPLRPISANLVALQLSSKNFLSKHELIKVADSWSQVVVPEFGAQYSLVKYEPSYLLVANQVTSNPVVSQWGMTQIGAPAAWSRLKALTPASPVTVAVLDTGVPAQHPLLAQEMWPESEEGAENHGKNVTDAALDAATPSGPSPIWDTTDTSMSAHGSHVAGVVAATSTFWDLAADASGTSWAQIMAVKFTEEDAFACTDGLLRAIDFAVDPQVVRSSGIESKPAARVVNLSYSLPVSSALLQSKLMDVYASHPEVLFVVAVTDHLVASQKLSTQQPDYPASYHLKNVLAVTSSEESGCRMGAYGSGTVDIGAPGDMIQTTDQLGGYTSGDGSSLAAPFVAAAAAAVTAFAPATWQAREVKGYLLRTANRASCGQSQSAKDLRKKCTGLNVKGSHVFGSMCSSVRSGGILDLNAATSPPLANVKIGQTMTLDQWRQGPAVKVSWSEKLIGSTPDWMHDLCDQIYADLLVEDTGTTVIALTPHMTLVRNKSEKFTVATSGSLPSSGTPRLRLTCADSNMSWLSGDTASWTDAE